MNRAEKIHPGGPDEENIEFGSELQTTHELEAGPGSQDPPAASFEKQPTIPEAPAPAQAAAPTQAGGGGGPFPYTPEDLTDPVAGSGKPVLFDWQRKTAEWGPWGGGAPALLAALKVDPAAGLDDADEADKAARRAHFGTNAREGQPPVTYWELIWEGLHDFTLLLLIAAAAVSVLLGGFFEGWKAGWYEGAAILVAVVIVLNVAAVNDLQKDKQFRQLDKKNNQRMVKVLRGGRVIELMTDFLLVGDVVRLEAGDMSPADCLYLRGSNVEMDESTLTGESDMMKKSPERPFLISGSTMSAGECEAVVLGVGRHCLQGIMMKELETEVQPTPLQLKLEVLATQVSKIGFFVALVCFCAMFVTHMVLWASGEGTVDEATGERAWATSNYTALLSYFITAVTVLVVAIPEGLPLAVTISLAYSVRKMQKDQILVRHLEACETMGGATTICTDKTGTLTQNKMTVVQAWVDDSTVAGGGAFLNEDGTGSAEGYAAFVARFNAFPESFTRLVHENSCLNSLADVVVAEENGQTVERVSGNKTEGALINLARKSGLDYAVLRREARAEARYPFTSARKRSSVLVHREGGGLRLYVKGAAEMVLRLCDQSADPAGRRQPLDGRFTMDASGAVQGTGRKAEIATTVINEMAKGALRTIALAYRDLSLEEGLGLKDQTVEYDASEEKGAGPCPAAEAGLTLAAIVGIQDPVRPEVPAAVRSCQEAGITVRMVTGDNINTAMAIAKQCAIYDPEGQGLAVEGPDFREAVAREGRRYFDLTGPRIQIMARSAPQDKHLLVSNLMERGQVVAVTGDGTNDGPALRKANVGFAMGIAGTEVAKQASDIVLMDDNFLSIVKAVSWGRNVYDGIRKFLQFQLTVNMVALLVAFLGSVVLSESPLKATQMLWVNLIMDSLAALALATELPTPDLLRRRPYGKGDSLISRHMVRNMLGQFFYQSTVIIAVIFWGESMFEVELGRGLGHGADPTRHYTLVFHIFVMLQVFNEISSRKLQNEWNVFEGIHKNPLFLGIVIGTVIVQIIVVMYGGTAVTVTPLNATEHTVSIIFGLGGMAVTMLMRLVPETLFPEMAGSGKLVTDKERQIWSAFTRRNSNPFVLSQRGKVGAGSIGSMKSPKKRPCLLEAIEEHAKWEEGQGVDKGEVV